MVSKILNIRPLSLALILLSGSLLPTSSWGMAKEEMTQETRTSHKSIDDVRFSFLINLGKSAMDFHKEDPERLNSSARKQRWTASTAKPKQFKSTFFDVELSYAKCYQKSESKFLFLFIFSKSIF